MAQRQVAQHAGLRVYRHNRHDGLEVVDDIPVSELHSLHRTRSARRVDHRHHVVGGDAFPYLLQVLRTRVGRSDFDNFVEVVIAAEVAEGIDVVLQVRYLGDEVLNLAENVPAGNKNHLHIGVVQDELIVVFADCGIDRHMDGSQLYDGHVQEVPFGPSGTDGGDLVAFFYTQLHQSVADVVDNIDVLGGAIMLPDAVLLSAKGIVSLQMDGVVWKNVENTGYFHSEKKLERVLLDD